MKTNLRLLNLLPTLAAIAVVVLITYVYATPVNHMLGLIDKDVLNPGPDDLRRMVRMGVGIAAGIAIQVILRAVIGAMTAKEAVPDLSKD
jgi:hypothetical protein